MRFHVVSRKVRVDRKQKTNRKEGGAKNLAVARLEEYDIGPILNKKHIITRGRSQRPKCNKITNPFLESTT